MRMWRKKIRKNNNNKGRRESKNRQFESPRSLSNLQNPCKVIQMRRGMHSNIIYDYHWISKSSNDIDWITKKKRSHLGTHGSESCERNANRV